MLAGAPVIVLANGGARTIAKLAVDPRRVSVTARNMGAAMIAFSRNPPALDTPNLDLKKAHETFRSVFEAVLKSRLAS